MGFRGKEYLLKTQTEVKKREEIAELEAKRERNRGTLGTTDQRLLAQNKHLVHTLSRRRLIGRTALGLGSAAALTAAGISAFGNSDETDEAPSRPTEKAERTPTQDNGKDILIQHIKDLPDGPLKTLYIERVVPIFSTSGNAPFKARTGNLEFMVYNSTVQTDYTPLSANSIATYQSKGDAKATNSHITIEDSSTPFPLNTTLIPADVRAVRDLDGITPLGNLILEKGRFISDGVEPTITVDRKLPSSTPPDQKAYWKSVEKSLFLKEAGTLLIDLLLAEEMYNKMQELGIPTVVKATSPSGQIEDVELIFSAIRVAQSYKGRYEAATDICGAALSFKAMEGTKDLEIIGRGQPTYAHITESLPTIDISGSSSDILNSMFKWAVNYPHYPEIKAFTVGDMGKLP